MAKIFITGSSDGLGLMAAKLLADQGHSLVLHARNDERAAVAKLAVPNAESVLIADLSSIHHIKKLADEVNSFGKFDAIIHNAGIYKGVEGLQSKDGLPLIFAVNSLAPYLLTCLIRKPKRLVYMSSDMHKGGDETLRDLTDGSFGSTYSDSKLHDLILSMAVARKWPDVYANAVHPGWVPTKMGGAGATDDLGKGFATQAWLAVSDDAEAKVSGSYFFHKKASHYLPVASDPFVQEKFLKICEQVSGVAFPIE
jgi:NAD(P)-dependent dehydrogenase (short-subunit alcohol dehydrogenase family)